MQVLQAWKESLAILWPSNLKLFLLVALKTIKQSIWPLIYLASALILMPGPTLLGGIIVAYYISESFVGLLLPAFVLLVIFSLVLVVRPSTQKKGVSYFLSYWRHLLYADLFLTCLFFFFIKLSIFLQLPYFYIWPYNRSWDIYLFSLMYPAFVVFFALFFFDSRARFADIGFSSFRALKMIVGTLPLILIFLIPTLYILESILLFALTYFGTHIRTIEGGVKMLLVFPMLLVVVFCIVFLSIIFGMILYTKQVHEHFNRYFPQAGE